MDFLDDEDKNLDDKPAKAAKKPGGTFASMGLSRPILRAVDRKGYKLATPIQRKCIPPIISGRDIVAMARTGSGKSAAFLLPLIDRLKMRQPKAEIRALVVSPTRELATQTFKFVREFTRFTNLVSKLIIGGESINRDFETITGCPDILVATPGRLAHVLVEMKQKLAGIEIVVFDEADRLFEPGYKEMEQVNEICQRLPESKQTLLFSATMPQKLADFAKADLRNPLFVRLDVETNLSDTLKSIHLHCNHQDKFAILVHLLKNFLQKDQMTVVFMPTRHHIEYARMLLSNTRIDCCYVYSSMDPEARKINIDKFTKKACRVMLVTDIAARGIDIPLLDIVINFNFPFKPKLYVHRVGRVARAGRFGCAISLISHDETPYLHALHLFFGLPVTVASQVKLDSDQIASMSDLPDKILGSVPQGILDDENEVLKRWHEHNEELQAMVKVCDNAMKPYLKTREAPSAMSVKESKEIHRKVIGIHPIFRINAVSNQQVVNDTLDMSEVETSMLDRIKSYKPQATIFEVGHIKGNKRTEAFEVMQKKRQYHDKVALKRKRSDSDGEEPNSGDESENEPISEPQQSNISKTFEDSKFYIKYQPDDYIREKGLELDKNSFNSDLKRATLDLVADDEDKMKSQRHKMIWDRKKKKYIRADQIDGESKTKKIRTESGALISASYQSGLFDKWKSQAKVDQRATSDEDDDEDDNSGAFKKKRAGARSRKDQPSIEKLRSKLKPTKRRRELKNPEEMLKERGIKEKREAILRIKTQMKAQRNAQRAGKGKSTASEGSSSRRGKRKSAGQGGGSKGGHKTNGLGRGGKGGLGGRNQGRQKNSSGRRGDGGAGRSRGKVGGGGRGGRGGRGRK